MNKCFVIQPFDDGGKYDKRYKDTYEPAIKKADYESYRVDNDPSVEIPIEEIDENIRLSSAVLADITEDNPNVWFEVGLAIAYKKKMVLICSEERTGKKYPFDIQHRSIIRYKTESASDYEKLGREIEEKLNAYSKDLEKHISLKKQTDVLSESIISEDAIILLGVIGNVMDSPNAETGSWNIVEEYKKLGYSKLAYNIFIMELENIGFIVSNIEYYNNDQTVMYKITEKGMNWLFMNRSRFNLISSTKPIEKVEKSNNPNYGNFPEDIPF